MYELSLKDVLMFFAMNRILMIPCHFLSFL